MTLLITGKSGFLGSNLNSLLSHSQTVSIGRKECDIICDLSDTVPILPSVNMVLHAAGKAHIVPRTRDEEADFFRVNYDGTKNLCYAIDQLKVKPSSFIFISTVAVYGIHTGEMVDENFPLNGTSAYAKSKILAENYLLKWARKHGITLSILRLPLVVGHNPPGNLRAMIEGVKSGKYFSVGKADARKSMVWAEDIAEIIPALARIGGIYNLTDGYHPTLKELEKTISNAFDKNDPYSIPLWLAKLIGEFGDIVEKFPLNTEKLNKLTSTLTFDDTKARRLLGWKPTFVLDRLNETL